MKNLFHVIKDPVHGTMQFNSKENNWIKPFIDSPNLQRLRHIKQLGMGDYIFPGACHTRFNHSLGCCYVASEIAKTIGLSPAEQQLVMIACLLHDIGHGPFSHAFEDLFWQKSVRHEDWTPYFLAEYQQETFFRHYATLNPESCLNDEQFQKIHQMITHHGEKNLLSDIVSSQLDADRLDYLLRDSHFCGVRYGEFDLRWLLHCMTILPLGSGKRLGITHKGVGAVEQYLMARRLMMRNIYRAPKKLAFEALVVQVLTLFATHREEYLEGIQPNGYDSYVLKHSRLQQFLQAVVQFNHACDTAKTLGYGLKANFLQTQYEQYKTLNDYDIFILLQVLSQLSVNLPAVQIAQRLTQRVIPKIFLLNREHITQVLAEVLEFKAAQQQKFQDWQIMLIETPHQAYSDEDPIMVLEKQQQIKPLGDFSYMINTIADKFEHITFLAIDKAILSEPLIKKLIRQLQSLSATV